MNVKLMSYLLHWCLESVFWIGIAVVFSLPYSLKTYFGWYFGKNTDFYWFVLILMLICGLLALIILRQLITIFKSIHASNPFTEKNAKSLRNIAICSFLISFLFFIKCLKYLTFLTVVVTFMFLIAGLCALTFGGLFMQAVEYKSENDLTI